MRPVIYIDVLLAVNFLVDYLLLLAVSRMLPGEVTRVSLCIGAAVGAVFSCSILLPQLAFPLRLASTLVQAAAMAAAAFGVRRRRRYFASVLLIVLAGGVYGGLMFALWFFLRPQGMIIANGFVYLDISPAVLVAATIACYAGLTLWARLWRSGGERETHCRVTVTTECDSRSFDGIIDTGNMLAEPFSGYPVLLVTDAQLSTAAPTRVIPYTSVGGDGLLYGFRPKRVDISTKNGSMSTDRVYVAVRNGSAGGDFRAIVNPAILKM